MMPTLTARQEGGKEGITEVIASESEIFPV